MEKFESLDAKHIDFIGKQHVFFVGTAASDGMVNVSPKGMDSFRVLGPNRIAWLNLTGSGNETAAHLLENDRMTIMFCSFDKVPLILRLYGHAKTIHPRDDSWDEMSSLFPDFAGTRQIYDLNLDLVLTSCGYAVPKMELVSERPALENWAKSKGPDGMRQYWEDKNLQSLDDKPTNIF